MIHPQHWPENLDYAGKQVVVIGSGATAVTLVPAMAEEAGHVTMLQRSPTYILPLPSEDKLANWLRGRLGTRRSYAIARWKNILRQIALYRLSQRFPKQVRKVIRSVNERQLRGSGVDVDVDFKPTYEPWDQRLCAVPDGDFYTRAAQGHGVGRDRPHRDVHAERGVKLASGRELEADIVITATGLNLLAIGGIELVVDGQGGRPQRHDRLPLDDAQRRAELRLRGRLHELVVDAEGRPRVGVRLPAARAPGADRHRHRGRDPDRPADADAAAARLQGRLRAAFARRLPETGRPRGRGGS